MLYAQFWIRGACLRTSGAAVCWILMIPAICMLGCRNEHSVDSTGQHPTAQRQTLLPVDHRRDDQYVGSAGCVECHLEISEDYFSQHPMGKSVQLTSELTEFAQSSLPADIAAFGRDYSVTLESGLLKQTESMRDEHGLIYEQSCRVDFAVGSGTRGYSFVTVNNGSLYQAPLTWYSQKQTWDLSPGYDHSEHPRFSRRISDGCITCHTGNANRLPNEADRFQQPVFLEATIGCERCHGPGAQHVAFQSGESKSVKRDQIVNPGKLEASRRDSVCYQCHLHGRDRILRNSRSEYDFRPGDRLSDIWVTFVNKPALDASSSQFEAVSQVEQMVASRCYKESKGKLGCISCHNPHRTPLESERVEFYRRSCLQCHADAGHGCKVPITTRQKKSPEDSCIQCHMPPSSTIDVPHTAHTDHRVLRSYELPATVSSTPPDLDIFEPTTQPVSRDDLRRAYALKLEKNIHSKSDAIEAMNLLAPSINNVDDDSQAYIAAARLLIRLGDFQAARLLAERAIKVQPDNESALDVYAIIAETQGDYDLALSSLERIIKRAPWNWQLQAQKARLLSSMQKNEQAIEAWKEVLSTNPLLHSARRSLIELLSVTGKPVEADAQSDLLARILAAEAAGKTNEASDPGPRP